MQPVPFGMDAGVIRERSEGKLLRLGSIKAAADEIVAAALVNDGWQQALSGLARAAGADGAVIMRNRGAHTLAAIRTEAVDTAVSQFLAGRSPPSSRQARVNTRPTAGFLVDHDDYTDAELARDPFYQEFLRPIGFFWHANACLAVRGDDRIELSLKRPLWAGPYDRADAAGLDTVLPELRAAAQVVTQAMRSEIVGMSRLLRMRGRCLWELDASGRVVPGEAAETSDPASPLRMVGRRLAARDRAAQAALDRAVGLAVTPPGATSIAPLLGADGRRYFLRTVPVCGRARDVFTATAAVAVLIDGGRPEPRIRLDAPAIAAAFGLTDRESDVACLLAEGLTIADVAHCLRIEAGTVRNHLKSVFDKTETNRQAELVALLARLQL